MKVRLKLFFNWGITFDESNPYTVKENANREVKYADQKDLHDAVMREFRPDLIVDEKATAESTVGGITSGQEQSQSQSDRPQGNPLKKKPDMRKTTKTSSNPPGTPPMAMNEVNPNESP